jgi:hypothetical protein
MKSVIIASLFVLAGTAAQAEIVCSERGCWETGVKIILVDPSYVRGQPYVSHRGVKPEIRQWHGGMASELGLRNQGRQNQR